MIEVVNAMTTLLFCELTEVIVNAFYKIEVKKDFFVSL